LQQTLLKNTYFPFILIFVPATFSHFLFLKKGFPNKFRTFPEHNPTVQIKMAAPRCRFLSKESLKTIFCKSSKQTHSFVCHIKMINNQCDCFFSGNCRNLHHYATGHSARQKSQIFGHQHRFRQHQSLRPLSTRSKD